MSDLTSNSVLTDQSGNCPHVVTVTEQQQQFVHQMLMALSKADDGVLQSDKKLFHCMFVLYNPFKERKVWTLTVLHTGFRYRFYSKYVLFGTE